MSASGERLARCSVHNKLQTIRSAHGEKGKTMSEGARFLTDVIVLGLLTSNAITLCALRARITDLEKRIDRLTKESE